MNPFIIAVLLKSFVRPFAESLENISSNEAIEIIRDAAKAANNEEILGFLEYIEQNKMESVFFSEAE